MLMGSQRILILMFILLLVVIPVTICIVLPFLLIAWSPSLLSFILIVIILVIISTVIATNGSGAIRIISTIVVAMIMTVVVSIVFVMNANTGMDIDTSISRIVHVSTSMACYIDMVNGLLVGLGQNINLHIKCIGTFVST